MQTRFVLQPFAHEIIRPHLIIACTSQRIKVTFKNHSKYSAAVPPNTSYKKNGFPMNHALSARSNHSRIKYVFEHDLISLAALAAFAAESNPALSQSNPIVDMIHSKRLASSLLLFKRPSPSILEIQFPTVGSRFALEPKPSILNERRRPKVINLEPPHLFGHIIDNNLICSVSFYAAFNIAGSTIAKRKQGFCRLGSSKSSQKTSCYFCCHRLNTRNDRERMHQYQGWQRSLFRDLVTILM